MSVRKVPSLRLCIHPNVIRHDSYGVSPFGHLRIKAYLSLPEAYRSLSRPSSAPNAKAFSLCSFSLELILHLLSQISFLTWVSQIGFVFANCNTITCCTEKPYSDLKLSFLLDLRFFCLSAFADFDLSSLSVFSFQSTSRISPLGGLKWIRTIDLALIRRAL